MYKHKVALFIGRFQPFHNGHLYSLKKCLEIAERVIVVVGSSQEKGTLDNPWSYMARKQMVCSVIQEQGWMPRISRIVSIPDNPSDQRWLGELRRRAGDFDVVVSNNPWVLSIMREAGYETVESGLHNRYELEGVKIRELMRTEDRGWQVRVPKEIVKMFDNNDIEMIK